jgi:hypothetical protein
VLIFGGGVWYNYKKYILRRWMMDEKRTMLKPLLEPLMEAPCGAGLLEAVDPHPLLLAFVAFAALW